MFSASFVIIPLVIYLALLLLAALILFVVIRLAVRAALADHYKRVRWYERTGEWEGGTPPRSFDA